MTNTNLFITFLSKATGSSGSLTVGGTKFTTRPLDLGGAVSATFSCSYFCSGLTTGSTSGISVGGTSPMLSNKCLLMELFRSSSICSSEPDSGAVSPNVEPYSFALGASIGSVQEDIPKLIFSLNISEGVLSIANSKASINSSAVWNLSELLEIAFTITRPISSPPRAGRSGVFPLILSSKAASSSWAKYCSGKRGRKGFLL